MHQKRIVTIQDLSCFGKCSLTVALPIISAMKTETVVIPTAVLSTHTSGFENFTFHDMSEDILHIAEHWKTLNLNFDAIYTGYIASAHQLENTKKFIDKFKTEKNFVLIDPVMGDDGNLYPGFTKDFAKKIAQFCCQADVVVPNLTEAAYILNEPFVEDYDEEYIQGLLKRLCNIGIKNVILTGVSLSPEKIGAVSYSRENGEYYSYFTERKSGKFHGTGDIFASVCAGAMVRGATIKSAMRLAVDFVLKCIKATLGSEQEHWYGVKFEECIPYLAQETDKII